MKIEPALWTRHAGHWDYVRAPLRPSGVDLQWAQESVDRTASGKHDFAAIILGVTPEVCNLRWPAQTRLLAVDSSVSMIQKQWSCTRLQALPVQGDWTSLPVADQSCDLVIGDGCFVLLHDQGPVKLVESVRRVLRAKGQFHIRAFIRPEVRESPDAVWDDLENGRIGNFHIFKFRLLASLCDMRSEVKVAGAYEYFKMRCADVQSLARELDWSIDEIRTIEAYRSQSAVYWYPTLSELRERFRACFVEVDCRWPEYEMGDRCPTFVLSRG